MEARTLNDVVAETTGALTKDRPSLGQVVSALASLLPTEQAGKWNLVAQRYPRLSLEFLRSRDADGNPRFVLFHPDSPEFRLDSRMFRRRWKTSLFGSQGGSDNDRGRRSEALCGYFEDVCNLWHTESERRRKVIPWFQRHESLELVGRMHFNGVIPADVREEIKALRDAMPTGTVFVVAEAGTWTLEERPVPRHTLEDPLVVLIPNSHMPVHGYLVAVFDVTTAEEYIQREFRDD